MSKFNPAVVPAWVSGGQSNDGSSNKYHRAVRVLQEQNEVLRAQGRDEVELTEAAIKALYIKWGGLILGEDPVESVEEDPAPRPRTRKA